MKIRANWLIQHDQKDYEAGATLNVADDVAEALIASGAASPTGARAALQKAADTLTGGDAEQKGDQGGDGNQQQS